MNDWDISMDIHIDGKPENIQIHSSLSVSLMFGTDYQAMLILVYYHALSEVSSVSILMVLGFR